MASPIRNIASRYLESINDDTPTRLPLQPSLKYNNSPTKNKLGREQDLDKLAEELSVEVSPSKTALLRTRFESNSATISSFKTPQSKANSNNSSKNGSPIKCSFDSVEETPSWAKGNYRDALSKTPNALKSTKNDHPLRLNDTINLSSAKKSTPNPLTPSPARNSRSVLLSPSNSTSRNTPGYEYLCRIEAIKLWLQNVLQEEITQEPVELITYIRNGIHLAKLANIILPTSRNVFTNDSKLQFRHTENINRFFQLLDYMNVPDLFRFELTDLYDAKNVPKVWFCLHALSYMLAKSDSSFGKIENLVDVADFSDDDIKTANRALVGTGLPNFISADSGDTNSATENSYLNRTMTNAGTSPVKYNPKALSGREVATSPKVRPASVKMVGKVIETEENPFRLSSKPTANYETPSPQLEPTTIPETSKTYTNRYEQFLHETGQSENNEAPVYSTDYKESQYYTPEIDHHIANIIKVQALAKGAAFRYRMFIDKIFLKSYSEEFTVFFAKIRGNDARRRTIHKHRDEIIIYEDSIIQLQSAARHKLLQKRSKPDFASSKDYLTTFQSIIRGTTTRREINKTKSSLAAFNDDMIGFQCAARRKHIYYRSSVVLENLDDIEDSVLELQSVARRILYERMTNNNIISGLSNGGGVVQLQAIIRGKQVRTGVFRVLRKLVRSSAMLSEFQSIARGGISRTKLCNNVLITLMDEDENMNELFAKVRGNAVRREVKWKKDVLAHIESTEIIPLQSTFRGVLSRFSKEILLDDIYNEIDSVISIQAVIRGSRLRNDVVSMFNYYTANVQRVIKAQAIIKSKFTHRAYKSLLGMKNPPLSVIKRFAYLLTDNDMDYQEEMVLSDLKDRIIEKSKSNEDLESQIENLDIKLSLLDRNKITVEEFIKHKNKYKVYKPTNYNAGIKNLERLNKTSRERIELYQSLFYFLQTKPSYFVRLYHSFDISTKESEFCNQLLELIVLLYPIRTSAIDHHSREEYFYIKFIFGMMKNDVESSCKNISDLTKAQSCFWVEFFLHFNNHSYQRAHLKSIMSQAITHVIENDELSFESDPTVISDQIADHETKVHGFSDRERGLAPQVAIKDSDVSSEFVSNLLSLREYATGVLEVLQGSVHRIPTHVRLISREAYRLSQVQFPEKSEQQHLAVAGVIFIKHYISTIFQYPENFGYLNRDAFDAGLYNSRAKNNLKHLSRVLLQLFSMKTFSDNFLKPLNDYIISSVDMTRSLIVKLIDVKEIEYEFEMNDYDDIINHERPKLLLKVSDMILLEKTVSKYIDVMAPTPDDQLFAISSKLDELVNSADDLVSLTELGNVTLNLNPSTQEDSLADSKVKSLLTQAKRCILYIIRVQDGPGLLELLISRIQEEHEQKFRNIVNSERKEAETSANNEKKRPYYKTSLGNLSELSYRDLKKMALEIILKLESMGQLTRDNSFQEILNKIAVDIKTKDAQRVSRKSQLDIAMKTNEKLCEKEKFLGKQLQDYNSHIESILSDLQLKPKDKKIFNIIPVFSKQYFYHRELRKHNRLPKFGSYIFSVKKLMDQKILLDFGGLVGQKFASSSKMDFMFSCHEVGKFVVEAASGSVNIPGAFHTVSLDQLLNYQYENKRTIELFSGMVKFDTQNFVAFIFKNFYDLKKE